VLDRAAAHVEHFARLFLRRCANWRSMLAFFKRGNVRGHHRAQDIRAKERMAAGGGDKKSGTPKLGEPITDKGEAAEIAAKAVGASHGYVSAAKKLAKAAPVVAEAARRGKLSITEAKAVAPLLALPALSVAHVAQRGAWVAISRMFATTVALNHKACQQPAQLQGAFSRHQHRLLIETRRWAP
jgi:hypothetical protein